jgi:hypothetical protein
VTLQNRPIPHRTKQGKIAIDGDVTTVLALGNPTTTIARPWIGGVIAVMRLLLMCQQRGLSHRPMRVEARFLEVLQVVAGDACDRPVPERPCHAINRRQLRSADGAELEPFVGECLRPVHCHDFEVGVTELLECECGRRRYWLPVECAVPYRGTNPLGFSDRLRLAVDVSAHFPIEREPVVWSALRSEVQEPRMRALRPDFPRTFAAFAKPSVAVSGTFHRL